MKRDIDINEVVAIAIVAGVLVIWWIRNNLALAFLILRILFYIAVVVIGIYCISRLFS